MEPAAPGRFFDRAVDALAAIAILAFAAMWLRGIRIAGFDYDEAEHAHVVWLVSIGLRPFVDFFECHPPFLWYPFAWVLRLFGNSYDVLFLFRALTAAGHLLFFGACGWNVALSRERPSARFVRDFALGVLLVASHPKILSYLVEFRLDPWPNALLLFAAAIYRRGRGRALPAAAGFGFLSTVAVLCSPKLVALLALFFLAHLAVSDERAARAAGFLAGAVGAAALAALALLALGLSPLQTTRLSLEYHRFLDANGGYGYGLAHSVAARPGLLLPVLLGVAAWGFLRRGRIRQDPFELAVAIFLPLQLLLVAFPFKQYYAPWFLLGAVYLPYAVHSAERAPRERLALLGIALAVVGLHLHLSWDRLHRLDGEAGKIIAMYRRFEALVPPGERVVAPMELRPLFRRDSFYAIVSSYAPSGLETEGVMESLGIRPASERFRESAYAEELEANPPALILDAAWLTGRQRSAIRAFLDRHAEAYRQVDTFPTYVRIRR